MLFRSSTGPAGPQGPEGTFDLQNGIEFPVDGTFSITQTEMTSGETPLDAIIKAQNAPSGESTNGASLTLSGGSAGDVFSAAGDIIIDIGAENALNETGNIIVVADSEELLRINKTSGVSNISAPSSVILRTPNAYIHIVESGRNFNLGGERYTFSGGQKVNFPTPFNGTGTVSLNFNQNEEFTINMIANTIMGAPTNICDGTIYTIKFVQGSPARTVTWNAAFKFSTFSSTLTATPTAIDYFIFKGNAISNNVCCILAAKNVGT